MVFYVLYRSTRFLFRILTFLLILTMDSEEQKQLSYLWIAINAIFVRLCFVQIQLKFLLILIFKDLTFETLALESLSFCPLSGNILLRTAKDSVF